LAVVALAPLVRQVRPPSVSRHRPVVAPRERVFGRFPHLHERRDQNVSTLS
jgi:ABC-type branched-subunit amino acid transport system ATPase component